MCFSRLFFDRLRCPTSTQHKHTKHNTNIQNTYVFICLCCVLQVCVVIFNCVLFFTYLFCVLRICIVLAYLCCVLYVCVVFCISVLCFVLMDYRNCYCLVCVSFFGDLKNESYFYRVRLGVIFSRKTYFNATLQQYETFCMTFFKFDKQSIFYIMHIVAITTANLINTFNKKSIFFLKM